MEEDISEEDLKYRDQLNLREQQSQTEYDRTVLTLSSGAFGISFSFVTNFVDIEHIQNSALLYFAWAAWAISIASVLISYYCSVEAHRYAIDQLDQGTIHEQHPGGAFDKFTAFFNAVSGIAFITGLGLIIFFVSYNFN